ncbi:three-Cys-motif partner protein TcmP [Pedobacter sp. R-06]|uniref:three-Cys-motif partner protein TcmP n=1 Tax=Pedobacter sp. R-06 TaxID=3404051 RepID=UPI003CEE5E60
MTSNNKFGGDWTQKKIEIITSYTSAYLTIMAGQKFKLLYFDGFAGSGEIETINEEAVTGAAIRIMDIGKPAGFDMYYFVELVKKYADNLRSTIAKRYGTSKKYYVINSDFEKKIDSLVSFLCREENKYYRVLAFVDPKGMQVRWKSLEKLQGHGIDMWILVPIGMGVTRLLTKDGELSDEWILKLNDFLGMSKEEVLKYFYFPPQTDLFGDVSTKRHKHVVDKAAKLYQEKLNTVFKFVSKGFVLKNSKNSPMYHFFLASNNKNAVKIANEVMNKYI